MATSVLGGGWRLSSRFSRSGPQPALGLAPHHRGRSRMFGPGDAPSARPALPLSKNCCFQGEIDCSLAFQRWAASTIVISPLVTASTSLNLSSTEKTGGRANGSSLHEEPDITPLPSFV